MHSLVVLALLAGNTGIAMAQLGRDGRFAADHLWIPLTYTVAYVALVLYLRMREQAPLADPILVASVCALTGIGLAALAGNDAAVALRQLRWLLLGLLLFAALAHAPVWSLVQRYTYLWALAGVALLGWAALYGVEVRGARSWVTLGPILFQPTEPAKILFVFAFASYLAQTNGLLAARSRLLSGGLSLSYFGPLVLMAVLFVAILTLQRDLGAALLLFGLVVAMITVATASMRYAATGGILLIAAAAAATALFEHVRIRFSVWLDPWSVADGRGYQIVESLFALGAGGFVGTGWGRGMADRIPVVETDFIYSLITEETGLLGVAGVLFLLAVISLRTMAPAIDERRDDALRLGAIGLGMLFALQSFLIVGGVTRLLPVSGVTLPFVSYGGSSLIVSFAQVGLAYNLYASSSTQAQRRTLKRVLPWSEG